MRWMFNEVLIMWFWKVFIGKREKTWQKKVLLHLNWFVFSLSNTLVMKSWWLHTYFSDPTLISKVFFCWKHAVKFICSFHDFLATIRIYGLADPAIQSTTYECSHLKFSEEETITSQLLRHDFYCWMKNFTNKIAATVPSYLSFVFQAEF